MAAPPPPTEPTEKLLPASKRWDSIKWQSRKIIEKTIKTLSLDMMYTGTERFTPRDVSSFIEAIRHNPSSQVLLPQLVRKEKLVEYAIYVLSRQI
jgi:hypothetical protein